MTLKHTCGKIVEATSQLSVNELGEFVDHLGDGTVVEIQEQPWKHHIASILPAADDAEAIYALWITLINIHSDRLLAKNPTK